MGQAAGSFLLHYRALQNNQNVISLETWQKSKDPQDLIGPTGKVIFGGFGWKQRLYYGVKILIHFQCSCVLALQNFHKPHPQPLPQSSLVIPKPKVCNRLNECQSRPLHHQVDPGLLALLPKATHRVQTAGHPHQQSAKAGEHDHLVALLLDLEHDSIHDIVIAILLGRLVEFLLGVDILDVVAIGDLDEEGISDRYGIDLDVDVHFDVPPVLLVGVGDEVHSGDVAEGGFVIGVDLVHLEPVLEELPVHVEYSQLQPKVVFNSTNYI